MLDFISSLITFLEFIKAPKYLKFWTPSSLCPYVTWPCPKFVVFLLIVNHFVLFSFITNPLLHAASLSHVTTSSTTSTSSAYAVYCLILLKIVYWGLVSISLITFSNTVLKNIVDSASPCLEYLSASNASINCLWVVTLWSLLQMEMLRTVKERSPVTR
jgi:hypothetical protein